MLPLMIEFTGADRFFIGSDYPHAQGVVRPVAKVRERLRAEPQNPFCSTRYLDFRLSWENYPECSTAGIT